jgi:hypothetical protein
MRNAKNEFIEHINKNPEVICAKITYEGFFNDLTRFIFLKKKYSAQDFSAFLEKLNFEYNSDYGTQRLFGFIWYDDGSWSEREEYDGEESWGYKKLPEIPEQLISGYSYKNSRRAIFKSIKIKNISTR